MLDGSLLLFEPSFLFFFFVLFVLLFGGLNSPQSSSEDLTESRD